MTEVAINRGEVVQRGEAKAYEPGIGGFFERVKNFVGITEKVERMDKIKETATKAWNFLEEKWSESREYFESKGKEIQERREKLGIVDTVKSYVKDGIDGIRFRVYLVESAWKDAEVKQLVGERVKLRESYEEAKKIKTEGREVPEGYIISRNQLREALRPIRVAELIARSERRELRQEAKKLRRKIATKQNAKELLAEAKAKS